MVTHASIIMDGPPISKIRLCEQMGPINKRENIGTLNITTVHIKKR